MISPFGIEHGYPGSVSKSFSRGVFKPITAMTTKQRGNILGSYKRAKGVTPSHKKWLKSHTESGADAKFAVSMQGGNGVQHEEGSFGGAGTYRVGGKKTGTSYIMGDAPTKSMQSYNSTHEHAHADVPRTSYRMHYQIARDPHKTMREEARADWTSGGHYSQHTENGSAYATTARAQIKAEKHPNRPMVGSKQKQSLMREIGVEQPRATNKQNYDHQLRNIIGQQPHYNLQGNEGDKAIGSYRALHDSMRAKGVPQPKRRKPRLS